MDEPIIAVNIFILAERKEDGGIGRPIPGARDFIKSLIDRCWDIVILVPRDVPGKISSVHDWAVNNIPELYRSESLKAVTDAFWQHTIYIGPHAIPFCHDYDDVLWEVDALTNALEEEHDG